MSKRFIAIWASILIGVAMLAPIVGFIAISAPAPPISTEVVVKWKDACAEVGSFLIGDGECASVGMPLTEYGQQDGSKFALTISDQPTSPQLVTYDGNQGLRINSPDAVNCLYYDGHPVAALVFTDGKEQPIPCMETN